MNIAFFLDTPTFEYFFKDKLGIDKKQYVDSYEDDYSFLYANMLKKYNIDVTLYLFSTESKDIETYVHKRVGCKIKFIPSPKIHELLKNIASRNSLLNKGFHRYLISYTSTISFKLLKNLKSNKPDLIYQQEYETGRFDVLAFFAKYLHVPLIAQYHGKGPSIFNTLPRYNRYYKKYTIRMANKILCVNKDEYKRVQLEYGLSQDKVLYMPNPVDASIFVQRNKKNAKRYLGLDSDKRYILFIGRLLNEHKGITYLIDAFKEVSRIYNDVHLLIVGTGPDQKYLMKYCTIKKIPNIHFTGWIKLRNDLSYYYNASEFFICPSIEEGMPLVNLEAMASGIPVIGTNIAGIKDIVIDGKTGFLVQPKNSKALFEKMLILLENRELSKSMGKASRKRVEDNFSCDIIGNRLYNIFEKAISEGN